MPIEVVSAYVLLLGLILLGIALLWLIIAAFRVRIWWGLGVLVFLPVVLPLFALIHGRRSVRPVILGLVGGIVAAAPVAYNRLVPVDLGPREKQVDGELHITLTGWDRKDYSVLRARPQVVLLQMANPDVDDRTLDVLKDMDRLRELDLNDTQVTDDGLRRLQALPRLEALRLRNTKITDDGFRQWLSPMATLRQLDLQGTGVTRETGKSWRSAKPGRRLLQ